MLSGMLISLSSLNRICYWIPAVMFLCAYPKAIPSFIITTVLLSLIIDPMPFIINNIKAFHIPAYPLDYSLLLILPIMLYFNERRIIL